MVFFEAKKLSAGQNNSFMSQWLAPDRRVWRANYLSIILIAQLLRWIWILADGMYSETTFQFSRISWIVRDHTWFSYETLYEEIPLWGKHYFGDLSIFFGFVSDPSPYAVGRTLNPNIGPVGLSFYSAISLFGGVVAIILFLLISLSLPAILINVWLKGEPLSTRIGAYCALVLLNTSALMAIDRGNILLIVVPIIGFIFHRVMKSQSLGILEALLFATAISLKPYLVLLMPFFLFEKRFRFIIQCAAIGLFFNFMAALTYGMSLFQIIQMMFRTSTSYNTAENMTFNIDTGAAAFKAVFELIKAMHGELYTVRFFVNHSIMTPLPGLIYLIVVLMINAKTAIPMWIRIISILSTMQMVLAASPRYDLVWSIVGCLVILQQPNTELKTNNFCRSKRELSVAYISGIGFAIGGLPLESSRFWSALLWCVLMVLVFVLYVVPWSKKSKLNAVGST